MNTPDLLSHDNVGIGKALLAPEAAGFSDNAQEASFKDSCTYLRIERGVDSAILAHGDMTLIILCAFMCI